ncbi:MAG: arylesterase [Vicinamibacterales bacterium]
MRRVGLGTVSSLALAACAVLSASCGQAQAPPAAQGDQLSMERPLDQPVSSTLGIVFLGDSLTAGLGLYAQQAFPAVIQDLFQTEGYHEVEIVNGGLSGDTTAGGLRRIDALLQPQVRIVVVALGGNDALRGLTSRQTHDNLAAIIDKIQAFGADVLLAGMEAPTNLGLDYQEAFRDVYRQLSIEYVGSVTYVPFLLEGVAGQPELNQADGIHPNAEGARKIADLLYPRLRAMVDRAGPGGHE